jgi:nicotinamidase-related amidase
LSKKALIVVDMVRDFTDPGGLVFYPENRNILLRIVNVIQRCREHGMIIIFARHCYRKDKYDRNLETMRPCCIEGSGGEELDPLLPVDEEKDYIIKKRRFSAFFGTDLDLILRENKIETLVITGTKTNCCIRATVTDAYYYNYLPVVLSDCVATDSDAVNQVHLEDIRKYFGLVMTSNELFAQLQGAPGEQAI